jgi:hypothetical protein
MSRKLNKNEFLILLKEINDKLEKNDIRIEIPYVYRNKDFFDHIKILIPHNIDGDKLLDVLKLGEYNQNNKYIDYYYKDFRFIFIKTFDNEFLSSFFYYSWDILPTLMNVMLNKMGLDLTPAGLKYIAVKSPILISNNIKLILEFLGLDFYYYMNSGSNKKSGFRHLFDEVSYILGSPFFNTKIYKEYNLNDKDYFYFEKVEQYEYALNLLNKIDETNFIGYEYYSDLDSYLIDIDKMFPDSNFLINIAKLKNV